MSLCSEFKGAKMIDVYKQRMLLLRLSQIRVQLQSCLQSVRSVRSHITHDSVLCSQLHGIICSGIICSDLCFGQ